MNIYVFDSLIDPAFFLMHSYFKKNRLNEIIYLKWQEFNYRKRTRLQFRDKWPPAIFCFQVEKWSMLSCDQSDSKIETKKKKPRIILGLSRIKRVENFICHTFYCLLFFFFQVKRRSILSCDRRDGEIEISKQEKTTTIGIILDFFSFNGRTI